MDRGSATTYCASGCRHFVHGHWRKLPHENLQPLLWQKLPLGWPQDRVDCCLCVSALPPIATPQFQFHRRSVLSRCLHVPKVCPKLNTLLHTCLQGLPFHVVWDTLHLKMQVIDA